MRPLLILRTGRVIRDACYCAFSLMVVGLLDSESSSPVSDAAASVERGRLIAGRRVTEGGLGYPPTRLTHYRVGPGASIS